MKISDNLLRYCLEDGFRGDAMRSSISDMILSMAKEIREYRDSAKPKEEWRKATETKLSQNPGPGNLCSESVAIDSDGYTIWEGGDYRPVDKDAIVRVKVRGNIPRDPVRAGDWPQICWMHRAKDDEMNKWDIVAYKVLVGIKQ